jgi:hypothetical protein
MEVRGVANEVKAIANNIRDINRSYLVFVFADGRVSNAIVGNKLRESLRKWQSPPDPSTNHHVASAMELEGTEVWFFEDDKFKEWNVTGSLLWIYGKRKFILHFTTPVI